MVYVEIRTVQRGRGYYAKNFKGRPVLYGRDNAWLKHWVAAFVDPE